MPSPRRLVAAAAALVAWAAAPAAAERRPVAVVDLTAAGAGGEPSPGAVAVAARLARALADHRALAPLADPALAAALAGPLPDEDGARLAVAARARAEAEGLLAQFDHAAAAARAAAGQAALLDAWPTPAALALHAELAFVAGEARLADQAPAAARAAFAVVHRLAPGRVLDPARFLPELVEAFAAARAPAAPGRLEIRGRGPAWVDGREVGEAPVTVSTPAGLHVVQLAGEDRLPRGQLVEVAAEATAIATLPDAPAPPSIRLHRARRALATAGDAATRAAAAARLAATAGVADVLLLAGEGAGLTVQAWQGRAPGLSPAVPAAAPAADDLLAPLAPPRRPPPDEPGPARPARTPARPIAGPIAGPGPAPAPWYRRRWVQGSLAAGLVAGALGAFLAARGPDTTGVAPGTSFK